MYRLVLSALDVERKRPRDVAAPLLRHFARGEDVDPEQINRKTPQLFGYPNRHSMHAEAGKTPMPEQGSITRADIQFALAKNLREVANVPFVSAFRAVGKAKLGILDIYKQTVEAREEELLEDLKRKNPDKRFAVDEFHRVGTALKPNPLTAKLIAAGAPEYSLIVRRDGMAFHWSSLMGLYEAIQKSGGTVLEGEPQVAGCTSSEEAIDRYLREVLVPEAWEAIYDLVRDGLELPDHEVLVLFNKEGQYIGRVLRHVGLQAIVPKLYFTNDDLTRGKISLLTGHVQQGLREVKVGVGLFSSINDVLCDEPVFIARNASSRGLSIKDLETQFSVDVASLEQLPDLRCGSLNPSKSGKLQWAIDGELARVRRGDRAMVDQSYVMTDTWLSEKDFPLLFPIPSELAPEEPLRGEAWVESKMPKLMLPPATVEFQERLNSKIRRDVAEARGILADPAELQPLLKLLAESVNADQIERTAQNLEKSVYEVPANTAEIDVADELRRLDELRRSDQEKLPALIEALDKQHPFLAQFGPATHWAILRASAGELEDVAVDSLNGEELLVELVMLASACAAGRKAEWFSKNPATIAVGRWAEGRINLNEVEGVAAVFEGYVRNGKRQELRIHTVRAGIAKENERRERARELGVAYAGDRIVVRPSDRVGAQ